MFNKRGLSLVITTLILVVLVLVATAIVWVVIRNIIQGGTEGIALGKFTLDAEIKNVNIDNSSNNITLNVKRNPGKGELSGMKFIFYDGVNSEIITEEDMTLKELGSRRFNFHLINLNVDNLIRISIVPIFKSESGKEIMGNIIDVYDVEGISECIANCTNRECGSDGCGGSCGDCVILHGDGWYCQDGTCIEGTNPCNLASASWNETNVVEGTLVILNVAGTDCTGIDLNYTIWEDDASLNPDDFADSFIATGLSTTWIAEWQDDTDGGQSNPPEYYFIARVVGEIEEVTSSDPLLEVTQACIVTCATGPGCRSSLANGQIVSGECCGTGDCYDCETGYSWNGSACVAGCLPETCVGLNYECGTHANGTCAGTLDCGTCGLHTTCPSGTCVCDSGWGDCNNDNSCDCDLSSNSCVGGSCQIIGDTGLVAYYPFNGNANDESGNGNHGTVYGATLTADKDGNSNSAYQFDGVDDYIDAGNDASLAPTSGVTLSAWIKPNEVVIQDRYVISKSTSYFLDATRSWTDRPHLYVYDSNGSSGAVQSNINLIANQWNHLTGTYDGATIRIYINGQEVGTSTSISGDINVNTNPVYIATSPWASSGYFNGTIDEVRIYNRTLTVEEIQAL